MIGRGVTQMLCDCRRRNVILRVLCGNCTWKLTRDKVSSYVIGVVRPGWQRQGLLAHLSIPVCLILVVPFLNNTASNKVGGNSAMRQGIAAKDIKTFYPHAYSYIDKTGKVIIDASKYQR